MTTRVLFRAKRIGQVLAVVLTAVVLAAFFVAMIVLIDSPAWRIVGAVGILAVLAGFAWIASRRKLVMELALEDEHLLVRTLFQSASAAPLRIAISETENWQEFMETVGTGATKSTNRYVSFQHNGVTFAVPLDHATGFPPTERR